MAGIGQQVRYHGYIQAALKENDVSREQLTIEQREWLFQATRSDSGLQSSTVVIMAWKKRFPGGRAPPSANLISQYRRMVELNVGNRTGRPCLLTAAEEEELLGTLAEMRGSSVPLCARLVASIAKGIVEHLRPGTTTHTDGALRVSRSWAAKWLAAHGFRVRAATTDRTISAEAICALAPAFYDNLRATNAKHPELIFNMDEFFVQLEQTSKWTWERVAVGEKCNIAIADNKVGFTSSVLTSMSGQLHLLQVIHKGKTAQVLVKAQHPRLVQHHRGESHFQDANTFRQWVSHFKTVVAKARAAAGLDPTEKAVLIIDAAAQHCIEETQAELAKIHCDVVQIPPKTTHVFQPADQFIIANVKAVANNKFLEMYTAAYATQSAKAAFQHMNITKLPWLRERKVHCLMAALGDPGDAVPVVQEDIKRSWEVTCIPFEMFGDTMPLPARAPLLAYRRIRELEAKFRPASSDDEAAAAEAPAAEAPAADEGVPQPVVEAVAAPQAPARRGRPPSETSQRAIKEKEKAVKEAEAAARQPKMTAFFVKAAQS
jgi:hypothetical protein